MGGKCVIRLYNLFSMIISALLTHNWSKIWGFLDKCSTLWWTWWGRFKKQQSLYTLLFLVISILSFWTWNMSVCLIFRKKKKWNTVYLVEGMDYIKHKHTHTQKDSSISTLLLSSLINKSNFHHMIYISVGNIKRQWVWK